MPDLRIQTILRCLAAIAQHHGLSADPARLITAHDLRSHEPDTARLQTLASDIGLDASPGTLSWKNLLTQQKRFPLLARLTDGTGLIVVGARPGAAGKVAVLDPADKQPKVCWLGRQPFCRRWRGDVMFLQPQAAPSPHDILIQGIELQHQGRTDDAARLFQAVLAAHPNHPAALYSLAVIAMDRADPDEALRLTETGVLAAPDFAPIWFAHATALRALGRQEEALANYDRALDIQPDYIEALTNSGVLLRELLRHGEALERFNRILTIDPNSTTALANCAILLTEFKQSEEAIKLFERLLALNPDFDYGLGLLCYERLHICDWTDYESQAARIIEGLRAGRRVCKTLALMAICDSAEDHFRAARIFAESYCPRQPIALWQGEQYEHDRIRIAYVSADLREHPVGHLMAGVFEHHDKSRFETIAISVGIDDQSRLRERMVKAFDHFIDARLMGSRQIAEKMREMEVDIAIDLSGYTADSRIHVFAYRPAPVQVGYLGYPGTLGTDYMDYIIADRHVIPEEHQPFYSERVLYLPGSYLPTDDSIRISERTPTRAECGLPETGFVFCSFSHDYKITPSIFALWMRLLNQVPGSVLWLMSRNELSQRNLRSEAGRHGVDPARLIFASRVPRIEDHLARYRQADLFLDTHPYNAHTTAADALMAGLPVVTYMGNAFPSRVAGSLLQAIGMQELIANSLLDYEKIALSIAKQPALALKLKKELMLNKKTIFNTNVFCRNLENIFFESQHIKIKELPMPSMCYNEKPEKSIQAEVGKKNWDYLFKLDDREKIIALYFDPRDKHIVDLNCMHAPLLAKIPQTYASYKGNDLLNFFPESNSSEFYQVPDSEMARIVNICDALIVMGYGGFEKTKERAESPTLKNSISKIIEKTKPKEVIIEGIFEFEDLLCLEQFPEYKLRRSIILDLPVTNRSRVFKRVIKFFELQVLPICKSYREVYEYYAATCQLYKNKGLRLLKTDSHNESGLWGHVSIPLAPILAKGNTLTCIEIDEKTLQLAKQNYPDLDFRFGDIRTWVSCYDMIFDFSTIDHVCHEEFPKVLRLYRRNASSLSCIVWLSDFRQDMEKQYFFNPKNFRQALNENYESVKEICLYIDDDASLFHFLAQDKNGNNALIDPVSLISEAEKLTVSGDINQAIFCYRQWLSFHSLSPLSHIVYFNLGVLLSQVEDKEGAMQAYRKSLECKNDFSPAWHNLSLLTS